ncbi:DUF349 domain-containing protein [Flavobacteriaceae bacterium Ap0902]|nr:DUF349 domain-containing protein [Flavobacteriaceae bacterium Ap0902]
MSTEKDNLPNADGQQENLNPEESKSINDLNSDDDTTGKAPIQMELESGAEEVSENLEKLPEETQAEFSEDMEAEGKEVDSDKLNETESKATEPATNLEDRTSKDDSKSNEDKSQDFDETADQDQSHDEQDDHNEDKNVPIKDYEEMSLSEMVTEAGDLLKSYSALYLKDAFNGLRDAFRKKSDEEENEAKEKFLASGGNEIDFRHDNRYHGSFYDVYTEYKSKVDRHHKKREQEQKENLKERQAIIDELKALYTEPAENNGQIFKRFRNLKTRWHNAGRIHKSDASNIFKTYYFHLNNFYEFLDLNQELREMDYEHNLEVRKNIIERAKKLLSEDNVQKALNELQYLHRMWKEEAVPVAEEFRETTWQEFKDITSKIHDRKAELNEKLEQKQKDNLEKKNEIIDKIDALLEEDKPKTHNHWQKKIKAMKALRDEFFAVGRVPKEDNQPTWDKFKVVSRKFNKEKNNFYKELKAEQMENLEKKRELVAIAQKHKDSTDWNESVNVVKKIQAEWKKIGHVPRKYSDKIWKEFSDANNLFFERYKNRNNEKLEKQKENLEKKKEFLQTMEKAEKPTDHKELIKWLNEKRIEWSSIGFVPNGKQDINKDFNKLTEKILEDSGLNRNAIEKAKWESQIEQIKSNLDDKLLKDLKFDTRKRMDEVQKEVTHLQTNLSFFSNADDSNPLFKNAIKNIEDKVAELKSLESKFDDLRLINLEAIAENQEKEEGNTEENVEDHTAEDSTENA